MTGQTIIHVGLNAHLLAWRAGYRRAGIHNYIWQLIQHLPTVGEDLHFTAFIGRDSDVPDVPPKGLDWQVSRWPTGRPWGRIAWEQLAQPWALRQTGVQLLHALAFVSPFMTSVPTVVTVHDLSFLRFPERFRPANRLYLSAMTRLSCRRARRVIAVSQATADETVQLLGVSVERVDVVPHGIDRERFCPLPPDRVAAFCQKKGLPDRFVLFVGTLEPRKNLETLVEAFARTGLPRQGIKLIIAGGKGWYYQEIFERVQVLNLTDSVFFAGFVPDAELSLWYNAAAVFVYPSLYEGFGMPLLEAMSCGTPVIGSDVSCMPEVVGDAGLLASPHDVAELAASLEQLMGDAALRDELSQRGRERAALYSWEATAAATVASYRRALELDTDSHQ